MTALPFIFDLEYADHTILIARAPETLSRLLHLLQHLAARIGLLLCSFVFIPLFLSLFPLMLQLTLYVIANFVLPSFILHPVLRLFSHQCEVSRLLHDSNILLSSRCSFRCPQASSAFKTLTHCFVILSSLRSSNLGPIPESYNASSSTAQNHRSILPLSFQKLTLSITRP